jgi:hypothetical protein
MKVSNIMNLTSLKISKQLTDSIKCSSSWEAILKKLLPFYGIQTFITMFSKWKSLLSSKTLHLEAIYSTYYVVATKDPIYGCKASTGISGIYNQYKKDTASTKFLILVDIFQNIRPNVNYFYYVKLISDTSAQVIAQWHTNHVSSIKWR